MSPYHPSLDPVAEHPFTRALRTWEAWSSADTWQQVVTNARQQGRDLGTLGDLEELTSGPDPLEALRANRAVVETMTGWQWHAMRAAREQGCGWHEIGQALGREPEQTRRDYLTAVEQRQLAARAMPELGRLLHHETRWRDVADDNDADRAHQQSRTHAHRPIPYWGRDEGDREG